MASFDVVSKLDTQELDNAVNQTIKEVSQRFDFKNTGSMVELGKTEEGKMIIKLGSSDEMKLETLLDILKGRMIKRGISLKFLDPGAVEPGPKGSVKLEIKFKEGVSVDAGREMNKFIKELGLKVQSQFMQNQVRVTAKKRDDLQEVIAALKQKDFGIQLQFTNYKD
jgi:uncharacterized protein YajQ (UPF0234 family)